MKRVRMRQEKKDTTQDDFIIKIYYLKALTYIFMINAKKKIIRIT